MESDTKVEALKRLAFIEGHLAGVRKMIDQDRYCVDVLKQTHAIRKAIERLEALLLDGHLQSCVVEGIKEGREQQIVAELRDLYDVKTR
ncbi:MAG: metal-sensing transcriptional repressor [Dehalococcoidia bacterium]|nr:metal-sensing transcriptional repressor [Dehalococcoidia bacterium]